MPSPILVTGGTGTLGRHVVRRLLDEGRAVRVLSRHSAPDMDGIDFVTGDLARPASIGAAVDGADVIVHCAGSAKGDDTKAKVLVNAAAEAGTKHIVNISVVGADRMPQAGVVDRAMFGYFGAKRTAERTIADSGIPWTSLRATQFHELLEKTFGQMARMPVIPIPKGFGFQPIAADEVAASMVQLALGEPVGLAPEIGGPRIRPMDDLARSYQSACGRRRPVLRMRVPGKAAAAFRAGANLTPDRAVGQRTWEEHLATTVGV